MKRLIVLFALFGGLTSYSQVYKFKAFQTYFDETNGKRKVLETEWSDVNFLVVINVDKDKIDTYGKKEEHIDIVQTYAPTKDANGNDFLSYTGVDDDGDKVRIEVTLFTRTEANKDNPHIATLVLVYPLGSILFRLKKNDN
jgi:hypothetical protein